MIDNAALQVTPLLPYEPALHDRVRVDGGREGTVIGFYRRDAEAVLVSFAGDDRGVYPVEALEHL
jgi:hypothetical protein